MILLKITAPVFYRPRRGEQILEGRVQPFLAMDWI